MSRGDLTFPPVPDDTARAVAAAPEASARYRTLAAAMESLFQRCLADAPGAPDMGDPVLFLQLTIGTLLQAAEKLPDVQAAEATRTRLDWKHCLHLSLNHPGVQAADLCLFRQRLRTEPGARRLYAEVVSDVDSLRLLPCESGGTAQADAILTAVCSLNQTFWAREAMARALEALATLQPEWLRQIALPHWYTRYAINPAAAARAPSRRELNPLAASIRGDIAYLLKSLPHEESTALVQMPELRRLRRVWQEHDAAGEQSVPASSACATCAMGACIARGCFG